MTDNEIIKALECCIAKSGKGCAECPYHKYFEECRTKRNNDCIDLLNRQKAEIENLRKVILNGEFTSHTAEKVKEEWHRGNIERINGLRAEIKRLKARNNELNAMNKTASIEAVREFADKVNLIVEELVDIMFDGNDSKCKISNCHKHSSIPCESPTCIEENKAYWKVRILNLVKEMVGE